MATQFNNTRFTAALDELHARWPGRACVTPAEALGAIGVPDVSDYAAGQRRRRGTYPFAVRKLGSTRVVLVADIAATLAGVELDTRPEPQPVHRGRGRPRKQPIAAAAAGGAA